MAEFSHITHVVPLTRVNLDSTQIFTYLVPTEMQGRIRVGQLVEVPFGNRKVKGVTTTAELHRLKHESKSLKSISKIVHADPVITEKAVQLAEWMAQHYVVSLGLVFKAMLPRFVKKPKKPDISGHELYNPDFVLTEHQKKAVTEIVSSLGSTDKFLVHGVTGSGKTEVYMRVIARILEESEENQVIVLVPEISLTPQAIERFSKRFGRDLIAHIHSQMKNSSKHWMWEKIRSGEKKIIIGPRSAVFAPVKNLGLVIIDEEHDSSYKQYDQNPKYHARTVAAQLSKLWECPLVLGDATPSVETYFQAVNGDTKYLQLPHRIKADVGMPKVRIIDMKRELEAGNTSVFSEELKSNIIINLKQDKQIILFLNRRGAATVVVCRDCGYVLECKNCSSALVWHSSKTKLLCHHCDRAQKMLKKCPECGGTKIKQLGVGTQKIETELKAFLGRNLKGDQPKIQRMDRDSTAKRGSHSEIYADWVSGKTKILIGTQMISKGWDVSKVGLVGIASADTGLHLPDYRSHERTFQILTQVSGRAGRGKDVGQVILQTYHPENYAVRAVKNHDYDEFFKSEIRDRREHNYPPFVKLVKIRTEHKDFKKAKEKASGLFRELIRSREGKVEIIGPSPAFIPKLRGKYRFQIILKLPYNSKVDIYKYLSKLPNDIDIDVEPESIL